MAEKEAEACGVAADCKLEDAKQQLDDARKKALEVCVCACVRVCMIVWRYAYTKMCCVRVCLHTHGCVDTNVHIQTWVYCDIVLSYFVWY